MIYFASIHFPDFKIRPSGPSIGGYDHFVPLTFIKIGCSVNPKTRVVQLSGEYCRPMNLLAVMPGGKVDEARIHRKFGHIRFNPPPAKNPEWFYPVPELMKYIEAIQENSKLLDLSLT